jgi:hypothetical protein
MSQGDKDIPLGLPRLSPPTHIQQIHILKAWLANCDNKHRDVDDQTDDHQAYKEGCAPAYPIPYCPRRLLYVGESEDKPECLLVETETWGAERLNTKYIALSHPWGNPHDFKAEAEDSSEDDDYETDPGPYEHFKTTKSTLEGYLNEINEKDLPLNFHNAVVITRKLGIKFLWIDSICIRQEEDNDPGDFAKEESHMQDIFSFAYCVIAASSTRGMWSGFLRRKKATVVRLSSTNEQRVFITDVVDNFERDVIQSPLNSRAWVLQERALARRTIYFTNNQAYWECRQGVRCETLSKMEK